MTFMLIKGENVTRKVLLGQRKMKKISQKSMAEKIGLTPTTLSRYENGKTELRFENLKRYAEELGLEVTFIIKMQ